MRLFFGKHRDDDEEYEDLVPSISPGQPLTSIDEEDPLGFTPSSGAAGQSAYEAAARFARHAVEERSKGGDGALAARRRTKTCPQCGALVFADMDTCFGCLHVFGNEPVGVEDVPAADVSAVDAPLAPQNASQQPPWEMTSAGGGGVDFGADPGISGLDGGGSIEVGYADGLRLPEPSLGKASYGTSGAASASGIAVPFAFGGGTPIGSFLEQRQAESGAREFPDAQARPVAVGGTPVPSSAPLEMDSAFAAMGPAMPEASFAVPWAGPAVPATPSAAPQATMLPAHAAWSRQEDLADWLAQEESLALRGTPVTSVAWGASRHLAPVPQPRRPRHFAQTASEAEGGGTWA